mgnify:CR=1 FL=1
MSVVANVMVMVALYTIYSYIKNQFIIYLYIGIHTVLPVGTVIVTST